MLLLRFAGGQRQGGLLKNSIETPHEIFSDGRSETDLSREVAQPLPTDGNAELK
jgi:hypothetical protein